MGFATENAIIRGGLFRSMELKLELVFEDDVLEKDGPCDDGTPSYLGATWGLQLILNAKCNFFQRVQT